MKAEKILSKKFVINCYEKTIPEMSFRELRILRKHFKKESALAGWNDDVRKQNRCEEYISAIEKVFKRKGGKIYTGFLRLSLKIKFFNMIKSGEKPEEYRELKPYWHRRLNKADDSIIVEYCGIHFTLGYPRNDDPERHLFFSGFDVRPDEGNPDWGATPGKIYYVITWDKQ